MFQVLVWRPDGQEYWRSMIPMQGTRWGRLTVVQFGRLNRHKKAVWRVVCDCSPNEMFEVVGGDLRNGHTRSCGCLNREVCQQMGATLGIKNFEKRWANHVPKSEKKEGDTPL